MSIADLTPNALKRMQDGEDVVDPIVQIIQLKRMNPDEDIPRFKIMLTDGKTGAVGIATNQAGESIAPIGKVDVYAIIKLTQYMFNTVNMKKVLILIDFDLVTPGQRIGRSLLNDNSANNNNTANTNSTANINNTANNNLVKETTVSSATSTFRPTYNPIRPSGQISNTRQSVLTNNSANTAGRNVHPIESLTPYQNKWCIRARVTSKNEIRNYSNSRGAGKLFSVDLADHSAEIRATGFNQECDRLYDVLREGEVYYIRGGQLKTANRQFTSLKNDYELMFNSETQIDPCYDEVSALIPAQKFSFVPFDKLDLNMKGTLIDVIGVLDTVSQLDTIVSKKTQKEMKKRTIRLIDDTLCSVSLTLWNEEAENFENKLSSDNMHPILAAKGVSISDFQGLSLNMSTGGRLVFNPEVNEAYKLRGWYDKQGASGVFQNLSAGTTGSGAASNASEITQIALADASRLGHNKEKPDYFTIKGIISAVKRDNCLYKACPTAECNKKLVELGQDSYRCEKCQKEFTNFKWRLMLTAQIQDFSGQLWVTFFEDMGQVILGITSEQLGDLRNRDEDAFNTELNKALFKSYNVRLRAKMETYNDETRVKHQCVRIDPLKYDEYIRYLNENIRKLNAMPETFDF